MAEKKINLFWYSHYNSMKPFPLLSKKRLRQFLGREKENYGDLLSKYIVEEVSGAKTVWYRPRSGKERNVFAIGSILNFCDSESIVWGSGIISQSHKVANADFRAVRGPYTRKRLIEMGYKCPEVFGDPGILLPYFYNPDIKKKYKLGIVPHIVDFKKVASAFANSSEVEVINLNTNSIERTTKNILACEKIISSSLHGLIIAHAYNIPAVWVRFSNNLQGDDVKFQDYFASVELKEYTGAAILDDIADLNIEKLINEYPALPKQEVISKLASKLLKSFPSI